MEVTTSPSVSRLSSPSPRRLPAKLNAALLGTGSCLPSRVVGNRYFVEELRLETSEEWIVGKTGIRERRYAEGDVTVADLATEAGLRALESAGVPPCEIDLVLVATSSSELRMPSCACLVQGALNLTHAAAWDINSACTGFVAAMDTAARFTHTTGGKALVIGADCGSRLVSREDRLSSIFFGDGAGAALLSGQGEGEGAGACLASILRSRGDREALHVPVAGYMQMNGRAIWEFATRVLPETIGELCGRAGRGVEEIALIVPHQANRNIIEAAAEELGLPIERFVINLDRVGNTMAASIPLALDEVLREGRAGPGDLVAFVGFGSGLAWGGQLMELPAGR